MSESVLDVLAEVLIFESADEKWILGWTHKDGSHWA